MYLTERERLLDTITGGGRTYFSRSPLASSAACSTHVRNALVLFTTTGQPHLP